MPLRRNKYGKWVGVTDHFDGLPWETREVLVRALRVELSVLECQVDDFDLDTPASATEAVMQDFEIVTGVLHQLGACAASSMITRENNNNVYHNAPVFCTLDDPNHDGDHEWIS